MPDLKSARLMYLKAMLFVAIGLAASALLLLLHPDWRVAALLAVVVWAFYRAYYFAFYVVEHYIDGNYKFAGLTSFVRYLLTRQKPNRKDDESP